MSVRATASSNVSASRAGRPSRAGHRVSVLDVVQETRDAKSFTLEPSSEIAPQYRYRAGQFLTFRFTIDGETHLRSYSLSSSPAVDHRMTVTVKRVHGGAVSNWINDTVRPGDELDATLPAGDFVLDDSCRDIVAYAGGSGITPIISIVKTALATTDRRIHVLDAHRTRESALFATELDHLAARHPSRLNVAHHRDDESGIIGAHDVHRIRNRADDAEIYICGPTAFMDLVEHTFRNTDCPASRIHIERFTPRTEHDAFAAPDSPRQVAMTVELGRRIETREIRGDATVLQAARAMGLRPPSTCEAGTCGTCIAQVVEGSATMRNNEALTEDEVTEGLVLTCQAVATSTRVHVVYE
ncbi:2Fe-2S iron-sulfur cluster-binding protein [Rhodococcus sp. NPDC060086]|uniref:2Fe-2S iron-sulfur cluster-binding protein n=1 Tax=Rhodococcus sp. NPDC060086 TaxID=3347055 RepID=UPI0036638417